MEHEVNNIFCLLTKGIKIQKKKLLDAEKNESQPNEGTLKTEESKDIYLPSNYSELFPLYDTMKTITDSSEKYTKEYHKTRNQLLLYYKRNSILVDGTSVPILINEFSLMQEKIKLKQYIFSRLQKRLYTKPTLIQMQCVPIIYNQRNLIAIAPTGSGKTLGYLLPIIANLHEHKEGGPRAIIAAPTFELGEQIYKESLYFTCSKKEEKFLRCKFIQKFPSSQSNFQAYWNSTDILITTPAKLLADINSYKLDTSQTRFVILDEADKFFEIGFSDQLQQIFQLFDIHNTTYNLFSATLPMEIEKILDDTFPDKIKVVIAGKLHVINHIEQKLIYCTNEFGKIVEIENMIARGEFKPPMIIFLQSQERAVDLYSIIKNKKISTALLTGHKNKEEREKIINKFRTGEIWVLICTEVAARGLDFKNLTTVLNYDMPNSIVNYIHKVGRTGRAGNNKGRAVTFFTNEDKPLLRSLGNMLRQSGCEVPEWIFKLKKGSKSQLKTLKTIPIKRKSIIEKSSNEVLSKKFAREMKIRDKKMKKYLVKRSSNTTENGEINDQVADDNAGNIEFEEPSGEEINEEQSSDE